MRGFLLALLLLMSFTYVRRITSCPTSCVVCSEDAIICHKLSNIIGVPKTTKVLMLTDGQIDSVDSVNFSDLSNMTVLGLSNNAIANITESAFRNLTVLRVLLLDHNLISSSSMVGSVFSRLRNLEILQLGNNAIRVIDGGWFRGMRTLLTLQLEGNLIARLGSATFGSADLGNLETLDLSDNLIEHVGHGSFRALPRLRRLDLSGNSLRTASPDAFSYLSWLSALNLDHNRWNCTCELRELSDFLSSYMQAPDKVLYNGRRLVCLSAANPAVHTVLELTEANCVPPNENITVVIAAERSISAHQYARDVSLAALFFFAGGVGLTVGVLYIFYSKLELKGALSAWRDRNWDDEGGVHLGGAVENRGLPEWSFTGDGKTQVLSITQPGQEAKLMSPNIRELSNQRPWLRDGDPSAMGLVAPKHNFVCHRCSPDLGGQGQYQREGGRSSLNRQEDVLYHQMDLEHFTGEKRPPSYIRHSPPFHRNAPTAFSATHGETQTSGTRRDFGGGYSRHNGQTQTIHTLTDYLTIHCAHCLKSHEYRQAGSTVRTAEMETANEGTLETRYRRNLSDPNAQPRRETGLNDTERHIFVDGHGRQPHIRNSGITMPLQRTVSFNLTGSGARMITAPKTKSLKVEGHKVKSSDVQKRKEKYRQSVEKTSKNSKHEKLHHLKRHKQRVQWSNRLLKVKLNLNPFRKNRVHPKERLNLNLEDMQSELDTVAKKSKLSSKDKKIHIKHSRLDHAASETKRKCSKVSNTNHADHAKKLSVSTKQSNDLSIRRVKSSRHKASRNSDRVKHSEQESRDFKTVDQEISESHSHQRKRTKKRRQQDLSLEDNTREYEANLGKSQDENSLSHSKSSKRGKTSQKTDRIIQERSAELEEKRQPQTVNVTQHTSVNEDSNDETRTLELKAEEPLASCGVAMLQEMAPKEVLNGDQPANQELKEGEETRTEQGGTSLGTEKLYRPDVTEESLRPSLNSSVLQTQVHSPDISPTQEAQHARMLYLGDALMEQKPQLKESNKTMSIHEEGQRVFQEQIAFTADVTGNKLANTISVEGGAKRSSPDSVDSVRPTLGYQDKRHILEMDLGKEEPKPLSDQGSTGMPPNQESESKIVDALTLEEEPKNKSAPMLDILQGGNSNGAMMMEVPGTSPQASAGPPPAFPQSLSTEPPAFPQSFSTEPHAHAEMVPQSLSTEPRVHAEMVPQSLSTEPRVHAEMVPQSLSTEPRAHAEMVPQSLSTEPRVHAEMVLQSLSTEPRAHVEMVPQSLSTEPLAHAQMGGSSLGDSLAAPDSQPAPDISDQTTMGAPGPNKPLDEENFSNNNGMKADSSHSLIIREYLPPTDGSPIRKLRLILPERPKSRPITPLDKKIR